MSHANFNSFPKFNTLLCSRTFKEQQRLLFDKPFDIGLDG